jgi:MerR family copper efflux transcriptional regulator
MTDHAPPPERRLMTIGELAGRTGLTIRAIRRYEELGLVYSAGRSEGNYRLYDESALWCADVIARLRSLGLTVREIEQLARVYLSRPEEPIGPHVAAVWTAPRGG